MYELARCWKKAAHQATDGTGCPLPCPLFGPGGGYLTTTFELENVDVGLLTAGSLAASVSRTNERAGCNHSHRDPANRTSLSHTP